MSNDNLVLFKGNLTNDPELRFTPNGVAVANFSIAQSKRKFNKETKEWEDGDTTYFNCTAWKQLAENISESLSKGQRVIVSGELKQRQFETKTGEKRSVHEVEVQEIGPSLKYGVTTFTKSNGGNGGNTSDPWSANQSEDAPF